MLTRINPAGRPVRLAISILLAIGCSFPAQTVGKSFNIDGKMYDIAQPGEAAPGELVIKMREGLNVADAAAVASQLSGRITGHIPEYNLYLIKLDSTSAKAVLPAVQAARQNPAVAAAFPNTKMSIPKPMGALPWQRGQPMPESTLVPDNDLGIGAIGVMAAPTGNQWHLSKINWYQAGTPPTATPIVAVIDTGVDYNHPDLAGKVILGKDYVDDDNDPIDGDGHGTHVSGIIAATGNYVVRGVSPNTKILAVRVLDASGSGSFFDISAAIVYARKYAGVKLINMSLGGYMREGSAEYDTFKAVIDDTVALGVLPVVAAGNEDNIVLYEYEEEYQYRPVPAWYPNSYTVGASQEVDVRAYFSNYDIGTLNDKTFNYRFVDIVAPGWQILSTYLDGQWSRLSGTSMAAPVVSGVAAWYWSLPANAAKTPVQVGSALTTTGTAVGVYNGFPAIEKRIDLMAAVGKKATGFVGVIYNGQTGLPLPGVTVAAKVGATTQGTTTTDSEGFFTVKGLAGGTTYTLSYAKAGFKPPAGAGIAVANKLVGLAKPIFMTQNRPAGQWSILIDSRAWHPGYEEAVNTYPSKPAWFPYNWDTTAGTFFAPYLKSSNYPEPLHLNNTGTLTSAPFMKLTTNPWTYKRPGTNFVIKPATGATYQVYTVLDNLNEPNYYYTWGKYKLTKNITNPLIQARVCLGATIKATVDVQSATGTGAYWHIATIKGATVTVVNKLRATAP